MDCKKVYDKLSLYVDNEVDYKEQKMIEKHLENCESCRREFEEINAIISQCKGISDEELPEGFKESLHKRLVEAKATMEDSMSEPAKREYKKYLNTFVKVLSPIAAMILVFVFLRGVNNFGGMKTASEFRTESADKFSAADSAAPLTEDAKNEELVKKNIVKGKGDMKEESFPEEGTAEIHGFAPDAPMSLKRSVAAGETADEKLKQSAVDKSGQHKKEFLKSEVQNDIDTDIKNKVVEENGAGATGFSASAAFVGTDNDITVEIITEEIVNTELEIRKMAEEAGAEIIDDAIAFMAVEPSENKATEKADNKDGGTGEKTLSIGVYGNGGNTFIENLKKQFTEDAIKVEVPEAENTDDYTIIRITIKTKN